MNYSVLPLLFRLCLSCATSILKVVSIFLEDVNFTAPPLSLKPRLISSEEAFVSTVISFTFLPDCALSCSEDSDLKAFTEILRKIMIFFHISKFLKILGLQ